MQIKNLLFGIIYGGFSEKQRADLLETLTATLEQQMAKKKKQPKTLAQVLDPANGINGLKTAVKKRALTPDEARADLEAHGGGSDSILNWIRGRNAMRAEGFELSSPFIFFRVNGMDADAKIEGDKVVDVDISDPAIVELPSDVEKELIRQCQEWYDGVIADATDGRR